MPCYRPLVGYYAKNINASGKRSVVFNIRDAERTEPEHRVTLPCGSCCYCRLEHSRNWAVRAMHEASLYDRNCFLTLTYNDEYLPVNHCLDYDAPVKFMKRLRQEFGEGIRSFGCAEYGEKLSRPHYHLCLFNFDFDDKIHWSTENEQKYYVSKKLQELWPYGHCIIGDVTFESAAYVARYITKKITGTRADSHYEFINEKTGEVIQKPPEKSICISRRPGIGKDWFDRYYQRIIEFDSVICRGREVKPPKYYDRLLEKINPEALKKLKIKRKEKSEEAQQKILDEDHKAMQVYSNKHNAWENSVTTPKPRLYVIEEVKETKMKLLKRKIEI
jgi:hypothetical protein